MKNSDVVVDIMTGLAFLWVLAVWIFHLTRFGGIK
jgi:hypothetical protein